MDWVTLRASRIYFALTVFFDEDFEFYHHFHDIILYKNVSYKYTPKILTINPTFPSSPFLLIQHSQLLSGPYRLLLQHSLLSLLLPHYPLYQLTLLNFSMVKLLNLLFLLQLHPQPFLLQPLLVSQSLR